MDQTFPQLEKLTLALSLLASFRPLDVVCIRWILYQGIQTDPKFLMLIVLTMSRSTTFLISVPLAPLLLGMSTFSYIFGSISPFVLNKLDGWTRPSRGLCCLVTIHRKAGMTCAHPSTMQTVT